MLTLPVTDYGMASPEVGHSDNRKRWRSRTPRPMTRGMRGATRLSCGLRLSVQTESSRATQRRGI